MRSDRTYRVPAASSNGPVPDRAPRATSEVSTVSSPLPETGPVPADRFPTSDDGCAAFVTALGLPGYLDVHVHALPPRLQAAVWAYFDQLDEPPWPITYRDDEPVRLETLRRLGVVAHPALAYAHRPGVAAWCNDHTLALAETHEQVLPTFTFYPEPGVEAYVGEALGRGGRVAKVHLQLGRFHATDPALDGVWQRLSEARIPVVIHASAVYGVDGGAAFCGPRPVAELLTRFPDLVLIVAHLGAPDPSGGFLALAEHEPGVHLDTAMVLTDPPYGEPYPAERLGRLTALVDDGKLLFGSDFPTIPHPYAAQVRGMARLELTTAQLRLLFHGAADRLLRVTGRR